MRRQKSSHKINNKVVRRRFLRCCVERFSRVMSRKPIPPELRADNWLDGVSQREDHVVSHTCRLERPVKQFDHAVCLRMVWVCSDVLYAERGVNVVPLTGWTRTVVPGQPRQRDPEHRSRQSGAIRRWRRPCSSTFTRWLPAA